MGAVARSLHSNTSKTPGFGPLVPCLCQCGGTLTQFDATGRERKYLWGHNTKDTWRLLHERIETLQPEKLRTGR
jgi:hypothetical protein